MKANPKSPQVNALKAMRDELRLKVHLAGMELKSEWEKLEPQLEHVIAETAVVSGEALADLQKRLEELRRRLA
jgi:hypothetical protein